MNFFASLGLSRLDSQRSAQLWFSSPVLKVVMGSIHFLLSGIKIWLRAIEKYFKKSWHRFCFLPLFSQHPRSSILFAFSETRWGKFDPGEISSKMCKSAHWDFDSCCCWCCYGGGYPLADSYFCTDKSECNAWDAKLSRTLKRIHA